jgi:hypothetical protein
MCRWPETANTCPSDCGSYALSAYTGQRAKYIDPSCTHAGNGLADHCASGAGQPGRFNELQAALNSLVGGDTLYLHPGNYWRWVEGTRITDPGGIYVKDTVTGSEAPTANRPIVITAANPSQPPVLHSYNPAGAPGADRSRAQPALSVYANHTIVDGLHVVGRLQMWGVQGGRIQNNRVRFGWGICDGNWAAIRVDASQDVVVHHNLVEDVTDDSMCAGYDDRPSGLKEFSGTRLVWEFNTVRNVSRWAFDLHRSSTDATVRFNLLQGARTAAKVGRTVNSDVYGNLLLASEACVTVGEIQPALAQTDRIYNNTCLFAASGFHFQFSGDVYLPRHSGVVHSNIVQRTSTTAGLYDRFSLGVPSGSTRSVDHNAWDSNGAFCHHYYNDASPCLRDFAAWQSSTGWDAHSIAAPGGACTFVDEPSSMSDTAFDLRVNSANCSSRGLNGRQLGAYGLTDCVGQACRP